MSKSVETANTLEDLFGSLETNRKNRPAPPVKRKPQSIPPRTISVRDTHGLFKKEVRTTATYKVLGQLVDIEDFNKLIYVGEDYTDTQLNQLRRARNGQLMSYRQVARMFGVQTQTVQRWKRHNGLPFVLISGSRNPPIRLDEGVCIEWGKFHRLKPTCKREKYLETDMFD